MGRWRTATRSSSAPALRRRTATPSACKRGAADRPFDATVICEAPKIGPHRDAIRASLAKILSIAEDRVALKATTTEKLGFTGRGEGVAALAPATVRLPG